MKVVITPEKSADLSDELVNKISCLELNDVNDQKTLLEDDQVPLLDETSSDAQVNERGHDRNQPRERNNCPYTRNLSVKSSNLELLDSPPITDGSRSLERLLLSGGGRVEMPSLTQRKIVNDTFAYMHQNTNAHIHEILKASDEEYVYHKIHEKICENEDLNPIPFDELSDHQLPEEVIDLILESEKKVESAPSTSPKSCLCMPGTGNNVAQLATTGILYMYNAPANTVVIQNKKLPLIYPKTDLTSPVPLNQMPVPCKTGCSLDDQYLKKFLKYNREVGLGKRDDLNRTVLHSVIMKKEDGFAVYMVTKIKHCFQRKQTSNLEGIQSISSYINSCDSSGQTPLYYAALYNQSKITECLLNCGADPNVAETQNGNSPLHAASERGKRYLDVVKIICHSTSTDVNVCNKKGKSPLHLAVQSHGIVHEDESESICEDIDSGPIIEHLLRNKASLTVQDQDGKTPLHLAVERCKPELITILEANANDWKEAVNMMDKTGSTALHIAAVLETEVVLQRNVIMDLLSRNAKPTKDSQGRLPAELVSSERKDIADLLKRVWSQEHMQYVNVHV